MIFNEQMVVLIRLFLFNQLTLIEKFWYLKMQCWKSFKLKTVYLRNCKNTFSAFGWKSEEK